MASGSHLHVRPGQPLAVVVGAGVMGMAIARKLGPSYRVLLADSDAGQLSERVGALRAEGHDASGVGCDVTDACAVERLAATAKRSGPVRCLVHVVGLSPSMADAALILRVNLIGALRVADAFIDLAAPGTAAVFVASVAPHLAKLPDALVDIVDEPLRADMVREIANTTGGDLTPSLAYQLSKVGIIRACRRRTPRWGQRGARIMSVSPGLIDTAMGEREYRANPSKSQLRDLIPLRREGTTAEVAEVIDFLVSDRASFISGIDLLVDGGLVAAVRNSRDRSRR